MSFRRIDVNTLREDRGAARDALRRYPKADLVFMAVERTLYWSNAIETSKHLGSFIHWVKRRQPLLLSRFTLVYPRAWTVAVRRLILQ